MLKKLYSYLDFGLDRYTTWADNGKLYQTPIQKIYKAIGYLHLLIPLFVALTGVVMLVKIPSMSWGVFRDEDALGLEKAETLVHNTGLIIIGAIDWVIAMIVAIAVAYFAIKFWKDRCNRLANLQSVSSQTQFQLLPAAVHFIRSKGECQGVVFLMLAIGGWVTMVITTIMMMFLEYNVIYSFFSAFSFLKRGSFLSLLFIIIATIVLLALSLVVALLIAYGIVALHRFVSELIGLRVSVATNVGEIKSDTKIISKK